MDSREPGVANWPVTTVRLVSHRWLCSLGDRHVGIYSSPDNWRTCLFYFAPVTQTREVSIKFNFDESISRVTCK